MKPVSTQLLFDHCYGQYAIAAVNVFTMEQVHGLFQAAQHTASPVIVQVTPVARNFAHPLMMMNMIKAAEEIYPDVVYAIHLDHGTEAHAFAAIDEGYTSVMIDASHDVFDKNVARTKTIVEKAHTKGILVEAELGVLSGVEDDLVVDESHSIYTDPVQAKQFVQLTGCDSLAVAVGTSHGAYKFGGSRGLQFNVLKAIQEQLPGYPLVLHGASSVKKEDVIAINKMGGQLADHASGVSDEEVRKAIQYGVCKVNIATDLRLLWTKVYRSFFYHHPEQFDPLVPGKEYIEAYKQFMIEKLELLGATGKSVTIQFN